MKNFKLYRANLISKLEKAIGNYLEVSNIQNYMKMKRILAELLPTYNSYPKAFSSGDTVKLKLSDSIYISYVNISLSKLSIILYKDDERIGYFEYTYNLTIQTL